MAKYEQIPNVKPSLFTRARGELNTDPGIRATKETDICFLILNAFKKRSLFVCHFLFIAQFEFQIRLRMTMMREIRGVMAGRLALMTLIVAQQEPLMKVLPWKSKIPDCSSYISPPAVLKPIHFSLPRLNHRINRALGKFETLTTTTFYRLTTAANDLFFFKWKQIEPEFIPLCDSNDPFHVDLVRLIHQCDPMVQYLELWGRAYFAFAIGS